MPLLHTQKGARKNARTRNATSPRGFPTALRRRFQGVGRPDVCAAGRCSSRA